jgi:DNA-binding response OmpR family regulator
VGESELSLTAKEFALLEYFARHPDQVLQRAQIIEQVWDWAFDGTPRIVDVYVRILRSKLGAGRGVPHLETVRGSGYALRPRRESGAPAQRTGVAGR